MQSRGRFAPTPSGPLHLGNLRTALWSWLDARLAGAEWLLRIDDLDSPRVKPGASDAILHDLRALGLDWDGPMVRQSDRRGLYASVLQALRRSGALYPCRCSRRLLAVAAAPHGSWPLYPGTCRPQGPAPASGWGPAGTPPRLPSWRLRLGPQPLGWPEDGPRPGRLDGGTEVGDVVLRRADGQIAYHLATAVDELWLGIDRIVRGDDLHRSTGPQVAVMALLGQQPPRYRHVPLVMDDGGRRLAKRSGDTGLQGWCDQGRRPEQLIGHWGWQLGWLDRSEALSAVELLQHLRQRGLLTAGKTLSSLVSGS
ncbi:MAG: tRNA glutamyl-Q(34) synthetase GluQRS [Synechococcus sp.]